MWPPAEPYFGESHISDDALRRHLQSPSWDSSRGSADLEKFTSGSGMVVDSKRYLLPPTPLSADSRNTYLEALSSDTQRSRATGESITASPTPTQPLLFTGDGGIGWRKQFYHPVTATPQSYTPYRQRHESLTAHRGVAFGEKRCFSSTSWRPRESERERDHRTHWRYTPLSFHDGLLKPQTPPRASSPRCRSANTVRSSFTVRRTTTPTLHYGPLSDSQPYQSSSSELERRFRELSLNVPGEAQYCDATCSQDVQLKEEVAIGSANEVESAAPEEPVTGPSSAPPSKPNSTSPERRLLSPSAPCTAGSVIYSSSQLRTATTSRKRKGRKNSRNQADDVLLTRVTERKSAMSSGAASAAHSYGGERLLPRKGSRQPQHSNPNALLHSTTTFDLRTSTRILTRGDFFYHLRYDYDRHRKSFIPIQRQLTHSQTCVAVPQFIWLDTRSYLLLWSSTPNHTSTLFHSSIRLEDINHITAHSFFQPTTARSDGAFLDAHGKESGKLYYVISIQSSKVVLEIATELQLKADTWYDALHNVCEFIKHSALERRPKLPD